MNTSQTRLQFIGHALNGDGPFRPAIITDANGNAADVGSSYLVRYPRESDLKYVRRNEVAWYASPLASAASDFAGYFSTRSKVRDLPQELYVAMADDLDGKGNAIDVFWHHFIVNAKARGCMCLLVDMPPAIDAQSLAMQAQRRVAPYVTAILPEQLTDFQVGDDGKFDFAEFYGRYSLPDGEQIDCLWHFDRQGWNATDTKGNFIDAGEHPLGECPLLIFTEGADFPYFGSFSQLADISKRLFNLESELDEILRSQTFSLLTMQVSENSTNQQKIEAARTAGETIGTANLMVHTGSRPDFIAPPDGPARIYLDRIAKLESMARDIGLDVRGSAAQESGIALQMRFQRLNAALSAFSARMEDLERRMWELARRWLGMTAAPTVQWPRDFSLSDIATELTVLQQMQSSAMPDQVIVEQQKRIVSIQFAGLEQDAQDAINLSINERLLERPTAV